MNSNQNVYESSTAVSYYASDSDLQTPEKVIFQEYAALISSGNVLDLGVGTGRTARFLASMAKQYVGLDYSEKMVEACRTVVSEHSNAAVVVGDARELRFRDGTFDFVCFSFNGIDSLDESGRLQAFSEVRRVLAQQGRFCFSSHNLCHDLRDRYRQGWKGSVRETLKQVRRGFRFYSRNPRYAWQREMDAAVLCDGAQGFQIRNYYIRPSKQLKQLRSLGFTDIECYAFDGNSIELERVDSCKDPWIYYVCS